MLRQDMRYADVATHIRPRSATAPMNKLALTAPKRQSARPIPRRRPHSTARSLPFWMRSACARTAGSAIRMEGYGIQVAHTDDPEIRSMFLRQVHHCPAGRLVAFDKATGTTIEENLPVSIGLIEDPVEDCSGPIWLRGGISLTSADGYQYEVRNRITICRCGASRNKPFCDGSHASLKFKAKTIVE